MQSVVQGNNRQEMGDTIKRPLRPNLPSLSPTKMSENQQKTVGFALKRIDQESQKSTVAKVLQQKKRLQRKSSYLSDDEEDAGDHQVSNCNKMEEVKKMDSFLVDIKIDQISEQQSASDDGCSCGCCEDGDCNGGQPKKDTLALPQLPMVSSALAPASISQEDFFITRSALSPKRTSAASSIKDNDSAYFSASTYTDSEVIRDLKQRKVLHYRASLVLNNDEKIKHYAEIAANTANWRAERTLKKCSDTIHKLEMLEARSKHIRNSSQQIDEMMRKLKCM